MKFITHWHFIATSLIIFGSSLHAEIQDGKVVAGAIMVRNYSLKAIQINEYTVKGGEALWLCPSNKKAIILNLRSYKLITGTINAQWEITSEKELDRLFNKENTFTLSSDHQAKKVLDIPLVDPSKSYTKFGRLFNTPFFFGSDFRNEELEFDITITTQWLLGQKIKIGKNFKRAQSANK